MNIIEYEKLCKSCDVILKSEASTAVTKAIPWLHVLNPHPTTQERYRGLWDRNQKNEYLSLFRSIWRFIRNIFVSSPIPKYISSHPNIRQTDLLIMSHLVSKSHIGVDQDFYFGDMGSELKSNNISAQILLTNHTRENPKKIISSWGDKELPRLMLPNRLFLISELLILFRLAKEAISLYKASILEADKTLSDIYKMSAQAAISFESISALRFLQQFEQLISLVKPKAILVTMEGHAFERLAFHAARKINPRIKCFGYQHAILFPHQHAVKRALGDNYDPDIIFTAGNQTISTLEKSYEGHNVKVLNIGTHRCSCPETIFDLEKSKFDSICLVLPDGNISECLELCQFAYSAAVNIPEIEFMIRLHPLNSIEMLVSKNIIFKNLPKNLVFSNSKDIQNDFKLSKWALYRGSGSAIHAVMAGCRPIYVSSFESINIDPLHEVTSGRKRVKSLNELKIILISDSLLTNKSFYEELQDLFFYCKQYFTPANTNVLLNHLEIDCGVKDGIDL
ncbi:hypothetical protein N9P26_01480 [Amylibacter sp.]|nr:hypothetical protein [Amylibacter sp.]